MTGHTTSCFMNPKDVREFIIYNHAWDYESKTVISMAVSSGVCFMGVMLLINGFCFKKHYHLTWCGSAKTEDTQGMVMATM